MSMNDKGIELNKVGFLINKSNLGLIKGIYIYMVLTPDQQKALNQ